MWEEGGLREVGISELLGTNSGRVERDMHTMLDGMEWSRTEL